MTEYYNIPTTTLGAAGLSIDLGVGGVGEPGKGVYITIVDTSANAYSVTVQNANNDYAAPQPVAANSPFQAKKIPNVRFVTITGFNAQVTGKITDYEINPDAIVVSAPIKVTGTVDTNLKTVAGVTVPTVSGGIPIEDGAGGGNLAGVTSTGQIKDVPTGGDLISGSLKVGAGTASIGTVVPSGGDLTSGNAVIKSITDAVTQADANGVAVPVAFTGGANCPATGVWRFAATLTLANAALTINGVNVYPAGTETVPGTTDAAIYEWQVTKGVTYTVAQGAVVVGMVV